MVNHMMRQRIQELIDGAPADPSDDQAIGVWLARIQALLIGRGSIGKEFTKQIDDIGEDYPAAEWLGGMTTVHGEDTRVQRIVPMLEEVRDRIDEGEFDQA